MSKRQTNALKLIKEFEYDGNSKGVDENCIKPEVLPEAEKEAQAEEKEAQVEEKEAISRKRKTYPKKSKHHVTVEDIEESAKHCVVPKDFYKVWNGEWYWIMNSLGHAV